MSSKIEKILLFCILCFAPFLADAQNQNPQYVEYIKKYESIARQQQKQYGIPASITLAQGLLESSAGSSPLAREGNNHFGIKCSDWTGEKMYYDDDSAGECFRKYRHAKESYADHALFLKNRPRYASLFNFEATDYESWAFGLKAAGYATDPAYAYKLVSLIENYQLYEYDLGKKPDLKTAKTIAPKTETPTETALQMGAVDMFYRHKVYKINGVKYVVAQAGDTYGGIADEFNLTESKIRAFNEDEYSQELERGTIVYLRAKKNKAAKKTAFYAVKEGDSMYSIAQQFAVKIVKLYQINEMDYSEGVSMGQRIKLR